MGMMRMVPPRFCAWTMGTPRSALPTVPRAAPAPVRNVRRLSRAMDGEPDLESQHAYSAGALALAGRPLLPALDESPPRSTPAPCRPYARLDLGSVDVPRVRS